MQLHPPARYASIDVGAAGCFASVVRIAPTAFLPVDRAVDASMVGKVNLTLRTAIDHAGVLFPLVCIGACSSEGVELRKLIRSSLDEICQRSPVPSIHA